MPKRRKYNKGPFSKAENEAFWRGVKGLGPNLENIEWKDFSAFVVPTRNAKQLHDKYIESKRRGLISKCISKYEYALDGEDKGDPKQTEGRNYNEGPFSIAENEAFWRGVKLLGPDPKNIGWKAFSVFYVPTRNDKQLHDKYTESKRKGLISKCISKYAKSANYKKGPFTKAENEAFWRGVKALGPAPKNIKWKAFSASVLPTRDRRQLCQKYCHSRDRGLISKCISKYAPDSKDEEDHVSMSAETEVHDAVEEQSIEERPSDQTHHKSPQSAMQTFNKRKLHQPMRLEAPGVNNGGLHTKRKRQAKTDFEEYNKRRKRNAEPRDMTACNNPKKSSPDHSGDNSASERLTLVVAGANATDNDCNAALMERVIKSLARASQMNARMLRRVNVD